jgi:hypothetical protein
VRCLLSRREYDLGESDEGGVMTAIGERAQQAHSAARLRFSSLASSLILAVVWFGWHLPQFFVIASYRDSAATAAAAWVMSARSGWAA